LRWLALGLLWVWGCCDRKVSLRAGEKPLNVLLIIADDLRPQMGAYQDPGERPTLSLPRMSTPHMDHLASQSLVLKNAYVQQALCSPSRSSFLTSRRPDTTRVYDLKTYFRSSGGNFTTLPQFFRERGYVSLGLGKIFHHGEASNSDDRISWSEKLYKPPNKELYMPRGKPYSWRAIERDEREAQPLPDEQMMLHALNKLDEMKTTGEPFFMGIGFYKPHLPFVFPAEFLELYPDEKVPPPTMPVAPIDMPIFSWGNYGELRAFHDIHEMNITGFMNDTGLDANTTHHLRRAYFASVSYIDSLVGKVLWHLHETGLEDNTVVALVGDHGFVLGEHGRWCKHTNFELDTHAPMIIRIPGKTDAGIVSHKLTELVDLFPTLVEAAGFEPLPQCTRCSQYQRLCTEGSSLMPLVDDPETAKWKSYVFSQHPKTSRIMGYSVRTERYRYTEWVMFNNGKDQRELPGPVWSKIEAKDLYDYQEGGFPDLETRNVVHLPKYKNIVKKLAKVLRAGWRKALPGRKTEKKKTDKIKPDKKKSNKKKNDSDDATTELPSENITEEPSRDKSKRLSINELHASIPKSKRENAHDSQSRRHRHSYTTSKRGRANARRESKEE
jgi:iduronate 2-sulfatase